MEQYDKLSIEDKCLVHRFLYYVLCDPIISDYEYDQMELVAKKNAVDSHMIHKVGSSLVSSYSEEIQQIATVIYSNKI